MSGQSGDGNKFCPQECKDLLFYTVVFEYGPMGFKCQNISDIGSVGVVVTDLRGQAALEGTIHIGDIVWALNNVNVSLFNFSQLVALIRKSSFPITIQFLSMKNRPQLDLLSPNRFYNDPREKQLYNGGDSAVDISYDMAKEKVLEIERRISEIVSTPATHLNREIQKQLSDEHRNLQDEMAIYWIVMMEWLSHKSVHDEYISYNEAKTKLTMIFKRMCEIGAADVSHPDPATQLQLREEYFLLEQDMERYNAALLLTDEYATEIEENDRKWEEDNYEKNLTALKAIRRMLPVDVSSYTEEELQMLNGPNEIKMPRHVARKFKCTTVLQLLRIDPQDLTTSHPSFLENLVVHGLTLTERRALHSHLREVASEWKTQTHDELACRRFSFFMTLKETLMDQVQSYNRHVKRYGPPGQHPYLARGDESGICCPLIGKQCPLKADASPTYDLDLGYPDDGVYTDKRIRIANHQPSCHDKRSVENF